MYHLLPPNGANLMSNSFLDLKSVTMLSALRKYLLESFMDGCDSIQGIEVIYGSVVGAEGQWWRV